MKKNQTNLPLSHIEHVIGSNRMIIIIIKIDLPMVKYIPWVCSGSAESHLEPVELKRVQHSVESVVLPKRRALAACAEILGNQRVEDHRLLEDKAEWKSYYVDADWGNVRNFGNTPYQFVPDFFQQWILPLYCCHQHETYCGLSIYFSAIGSPFWTCRAMHRCLRIVMAVHSTTFSTT